MNSMKPIDFFPKKPRTCGECTACCEGWLHADVKIGDIEYKVRPGNQCPKIINHQCSIHNSELRPLKPCKSYSCVWLDNKDIPDYMRPDKSGVILTEKSFANIDYMQMVETGRKVDSSILAKVLTYAFATGKNIEFVVDNETYHLGSNDFMKLVMENRNKTELTS